MEAKVRTLFTCKRSSSEKADKIKITMLLSAIGPEALERYNHRFEQEFAGMKRVVFSRFKFWEYSGSEGQGFDEHSTELRMLAEACKFLENDNMIHNKIVFSMKEKSLQERLLREVKVTLKEQ